MAKLNTKFYKGMDVYSDGDAVEDRLMAFARSGKNVLDMPQEEADFAILYHFALTRENILNWYPFKKTDRILEVGAGCGAITGVLCRLAGSVTAVELSHRRASINLERHKDLDNLEICVGNLNDMTFPEKFDYVVLNGVFEYAASFTEGNNPYLDFLKNMIPLMKPNGKMLIAIENRLGMKYFSGAPEDHLDGYFTGLNGYEPDSSVRTFSHDELAKLVESSGLSCQRFYYPYPDYKFPKEIFTDDTLATHGYGKPQVNLNTKRLQYFREESIDRVLASEGAAASVANSFLLEASAAELEKTQVIYAKLNDDRAPKFRQITKIWKDGKTRWVTKQPMGAEAVEHIRNMVHSVNMNGITTLTGTLEGDTICYDYLEQHSIGERATQLILDHQVQEGKKLIDAYLDRITKGQTEEEPYETPEFQEMFGMARANRKLATIHPVNIDVIADNMFETDSGYMAIDPEWTVDFPIPAAFLVWRVINEFYANEPMVEQQLPRIDWYAEYGITPADEDVFRAWETHFAKKYVKSNIMEKFSKAPLIPEIPLITATLYYNTGAGYNEEEKLEHRFLLRDGKFELKYDLPTKPGAVISYRWDPTLRQPCLCLIESAVDQNGNPIQLLPKAADNIVTSEEGTAFYTPDVQYEIAGDISGIQTISLRGRIHCYNADEMLEGRYKLEQQMAPSKALPEKARAVDIVIPVYNAYEDLCLCIESVKRHTDLTHNRIILVNDASPDERIAPYLDSLAGPNILVHHNDGNKGFSANVNYGFGCSEEHDVLLLNTDTIVTVGWLDKISACAARDPHIATVTPLSNAATLCSVPDFCKDNKLPEGYTVDTFGELVEKASLHLYPRITVAVGFCMYIKREVIREVGLFDAETFERGYGEENDFCNRAMLLGYYHVMCDDTFIFHSGSASFKAAEGTNKAKLIQAHDAILRQRYPDLMHQNDLHVLRNPNAIVQQNIWLHLALDPACKTILYVSHRDFRKEAADSVGGVQLHLKDLTRGLQDKFNVVVVARNNVTLDVTAYHKDRTYTMRFYIEEQSITPHPFDPQMHELFKDIIKSMGADIVHIQHIYGMSMEPFYVAKELCLPLVCTLHDYYYICPRIKLMDGQGNFCGGCSDTTVCNTCMESANNFEFEKPKNMDFIGIWRREMHKALELCDLVIAPSQTAVDYYEKIFPSIGQRTRVIPHGIDLPQHNAASDTLRCDKNEQFHVAFLGGINQAKGSKVALKLIKGNDKIMWHIIGGLGDKELEYLQKKNLQWTGWYDREQLAQQLKENKIDLVCIPSVWPETFCYTVSEASECGVPVICFDVGAQGARVKEKELGWAIPLADGAAGMQTMIEYLSTKPLEYKKAVECCLAQNHRTTQDMVDEYEALYTGCVAETEKHPSRVGKLMRRQIVNQDVQHEAQRLRDELSRIEFSPGYHTLVKLQKGLLSKKLFRRLFRI